MLNLETIVDRVDETLTARRVFGEPVVRNGTTVIPVARIMGGAGGGEGPTPSTATGEAGTETKPVTSGGVGFGMAARPAGVYVVRGGFGPLDPGRRRQPRPHRDAGRRDRPAPHDPLDREGPPGPRVITSSRRRPVSTPSRDIEHRRRALVGCASTATGGRPPTRVRRLSSAACPGRRGRRGRAGTARSRR